MSVTEMLLKADAKKVNELATGTFKSKALAKALGKKGEITIKIREVPARQMNEYLNGMVDTQGNFDLSKAYEAGKKMIVAGVVDPDMKDNALKEHFNCPLAVDLAEKLFKNEVIDLMNAIRELSDIESVSEEDIKN